MIIYEDYMIIDYHFFFFFYSFTSILRKSAKYFYLQHFCALYHVQCLQCWNKRGHLKKASLVVYKDFL